MREFPDKHFDVAIVDPPYGIGFGSFNRTNRDCTGKRFKANKYKQGDWDSHPPGDEYFAELLRVSKNQIVWGGNYFHQLWSHGGKCFIFWFKGNPVPNFSDGELAWTSFNRPALQFDYRYYGSLQGEGVADAKIHPTQKPVELYRWLLSKFSKPGQRILDTHLGSGSHAIACHYFGAHLTACEIDPDYYAAAMDRIGKETAQGDFFTPTMEPEAMGQEALAL
jgi:site-specific DNA-methyltransferase (adenine-specific)